MRSARVLSHLSRHLDDVALRFLRLVDALRATPRLAGQGDEAVAFHVEALREALEHVDVESLSEELGGRLDTRSFLALQAMVLQAADYDRATLRRFATQVDAAVARILGDASVQRAAAGKVDLTPPAPGGDPALARWAKHDFGLVVRNCRTICDACADDPSLGTAEARALAAALDARLAGLEPDRLAVALDDMGLSPFELGDRVDQFNTALMTSFRRAHPLGPEVGPLLEVLAAAGVEAAGSAGRVAR
jgi:hypothetical protein